MIIENSKCLRINPEGVELFNQIIGLKDRRFTAKKFRSQMSPLRGFCNVEITYLYNHCTPSGFNKLESIFET